MGFDKSAATAALADVKVNPAKLSTALDDLFALAADREVKSIDFFIHSPEADTSDIDAHAVTVYLITGKTDDEGVFHYDVSTPSRLVPIVG